MHLGAAARHEAGGDASRLSVEQSGEGEGRPERTGVRTCLISLPSCYGRRVRELGVIGAARTSTLHSTPLPNGRQKKAQESRGGEGLVTCARTANGGLEGAAKARSAKPAARGRYLYSSTTLWRSRLYAYNMYVVGDILGVPPILPA